jgi:hypothetical protein
MISTIRLVSTIVFIGLSETNTIGYIGPVRGRVLGGDPHPCQAARGGPILVVLGQTLYLLHQTFTLSLVCHRFIL